MATKPGESDHGGIGVNDIPNEDLFDCPSSDQDGGQKDTDGATNGGGQPTANGAPSLRFTTQRIGARLKLVVEV